MISEWELPGWNDLFLHLLLLFHLYVGRCECVCVCVYYMCHSLGDENLLTGSVSVSVTGRCAHFPAESDPASAVCDLGRRMSPRGHSPSFMDSIRSPTKHPFPWVLAKKFSPTWTLLLYYARERLIALCGLFLSFVFLHPKWKKISFNLWIVYFILKLFYNSIYIYKNTYSQDFILLENYLLCPRSITNFVVRTPFIKEKGAIIDILLILMSIKLS